jgi:glutathione synthase/RimK-type ligase-like ATP-grasp enzyme
VGAQLFATEVVTTADDYRYVPLDGERTMTAVDLPADVAARCLTLADALDMDVCGIDLRRTPDGEHYCFEVNPIPGYLFYEQYTGQPIGETIAAWLDKPDVACERIRI